jgi:F-type H+-transporting ATPase subunit delta
MSGNRAAIRYAKAVLQQAKEAGVADRVFNDMSDVYHTIKASKELQHLLKSPLIKANDKKEALLQIFKDGSDETRSLIEVLVNNQRTQLLTDVSKNYIDLFNEEKGVLVAQVTTAIPLSDEIEKKVLSKIKELTGSTSVTLENNIDESILGGFILRIGDLQYNASIANKLSKIKREFSKSL